MTAKRIFTIAISLLLTMHAYCESRLDVTWGHHTSRCTYLSTQTYTGPGYGVSFEWNRPTWMDGKILQSARADLEYGYLLSKSKNSRMYDLDLSIQWGVERIWNPLTGLNVSAGASAGVDGGVMYLPRNGNNPAQALMWAGMSLTAHAIYDRFRLAGKPFSVTGSVELPSIGCFFSPAYGETYYEIYLGNHKGLAHFGWWGNRPQIKSRLIADWQLGRHALTLGVDYRYQGLECNHLTTRRAVISAIIGMRF